MDRNDLRPQTKKKLTLNVETLCALTGGQHDSGKDARAAFTILSLCGCSNVHGGGTCTG